MQHGFETTHKPEIFTGSLPDRDINDIKALLEAYKRSDTPDPSNKW